MVPGVGFGTAQLYRDPPCRRPLAARLMAARMTSHRSTHDRRVVAASAGPGAGRGRRAGWLHRGGAAGLLVSSARRRPRWPSLAIDSILARVHDSIMRDRRWLALGLLS